MNHKYQSDLHKRSTHTPHTHKTLKEPEFRIASGQIVFLQPIWHSNSQHSWRTHGADSPITQYMGGNSPFWISTGFLSWFVQRFEPDLLPCCICFFIPLNLLNKIFKKGQAIIVKNRNKNMVVPKHEEENSKPAEAKLGLTSFKASGS